MTDLGKRVKALRKNLGLSQEDLAHKIGYKSKSTINKIEAGINDIPQAKLHLFAEVLNTTPSYLVSGDKSKDSHEIEFYMPSLDEFFDNYPSETHDYLSNLCKIERENQSLSIHEVCSATNIEINKYKKFESNKERLDINTIRKIMNVLNLSPMRAQSILEGSLGYLHKEDPLFTKINASRPKELVDIINFLHTLKGEELDEFMDLVKKHMTAPAIDDIPSVYRDALRTSFSKK